MDLSNNIIQQAMENEEIFEQITSVPHIMPKLIDYLKQTFKLSGELSEALDMLQDDPELAYLVRELFRLKTANLQLAKAVVQEDNVGKLYITPALRILAKTEHTFDRAWIKNIKNSRCRDCTACQNVADFGELEEPVIDFLKSKEFRDLDINMRIKLVADTLVFVTVDKWKVTREPEAYDLIQGCFNDYLEYLNTVPQLTENMEITLVECAQASEFKRPLLEWLSSKFVLCESIENFWFLKTVPPSLSNLVKEPRFISLQQFCIIMAAVYLRDAPASLVTFYDGMIFSNVAYTIVYWYIRRALSERSYTLRSPLHHIDLIPYLRTIILKNSYAELNVIVSLLTEILATAPYAYLKDTQFNWEPLRELMVEYPKLDEFQDLLTQIDIRTRTMRT